MKNWTKIIKQSDTILSHIFKENSAFLLFHDDADGCCAAAILLNLVSKQSSHDFLNFASPEKHSVELTARLFEKLRKQKPKFIVSLDLALTSSAERINTLLSFLDAHILTYDHHVQSKSIKWPANCTHINPLNFNLGNIPASYYSYILHKHYLKDNDASWVAGLGTVTDYRTEEGKDLLKDVKRHYPSLYPFETIDQPTALRSPLMTLGHLVNAGYQHSDFSGAKMAVEALREALQMNDPAALLEGKTAKAKLLHKFRKEVDTEVNKYLDAFASEAEFYLDSQLAFYSINPKLNITSQIATELQHRNPNTIIAVISPETQKTAKVSLRRGNKVKTDLAALAETTTANLTKASGGGHKDAAGCTLRTDEVNLWKKNTTKYLYKMLAQ